MSTPFGPQGLTSNDPTRNGSAPVSAGAFICPTPEPVRPVEGRNSAGRSTVDSTPRCPSHPGGRYPRARRAAGGPLEVSL